MKDGANPYERNGDFAWCGAFAAYCWSSLKLDIRKRTFPSTYRLWRDWQSRRIPTAGMRPGDIVVVGIPPRLKQTGRRSPMDTISSSVDSREPEGSPHGRGTPELTDLMDDREESGPGSETSTPSQSSTGLMSPTSHRLITAVGGRKMVAYLVSVATTTLLAILDSASTEVLLSIQTALGLLVGGNAAEHKSPGDNNGPLFRYHSAGQNRGLYRDD